jgi:hypothetical protein
MLICYSITCRYVPEQLNHSSHYEILGKPANMTLPMLRRAAIVG